MFGSGNKSRDQLVLPDNQRDADRGKPVGRRRVVDSALAHYQSFTPVQRSRVDQSLANAPAPNTQRELSKSQEPQFTKEYKEYTDKFEEVKKRAMPKKESPEVLGKKDELRALQVVQKREEEFKQRQAIDWMRHQKTVEEVQRALSKQIEERRQTERYQTELEQAYGNQINYRVAKVHEIELNRIRKEQETKRTYQSALLEQMELNKRSKRDLTRIEEAEHQVLNQERQTTDTSIRSIPSPLRGVSHLKAGSRLPKQQTSTIFSAGKMVVS